MAQRDLDRHAALSRADVDHGLVLVPGEPLSDGEGGAHADAAHGVEELLEPFRVLVESAEKVLAPLGLVLRKAGAKSLGE